MKTTKYILGGLVVIVGLFAYSHYAKPVPTPVPKVVVAGDNLTSLTNGLVTGNVCSVSQASSTLNPNTLNLTYANMDACTLISVLNGSSTGALTLVLPASSTMGAYLNPGSGTQMYIYAASTTAGNVILAATTTAGFSIASGDGVASSTAASSTIAAGTVANLDIVTLPTTNMVAIINPSK